MKKFQFVLSLLLLSLIISCTNDNVVTPTPSQDKFCLVQKIENTDGSSETYIYDDKNRNTKVVIVNDSIYPETVHIYNGKTVLTNSGNILQSTGYLNDKGFLDSALFDIQNYSDFKIINTFNNNWEIVSKKMSGISFGKPFNEVTNYQYLAGNLIKKSFNNGKTTITYDYEYYLDKVDKSQKTMEVISLQNSSVNLVKKVMSSTGNITNYTYEFDKDGKVTKSTKVISGNFTDTATTTYTWICK